MADLEDLTAHICDHEGHILQQFGYGTAT